ncbi:MAG TPA: tetratricopeptide repeat protein [Pyrinomonadaceae bacterium]|nr:tetratricopeptide repeat protein [Pyrinomonadaceae bacterium]
MRVARRFKIIAMMAVIASTLLVSDLGSLKVLAQAPLTYPELITALQTRLPNQSFRTKPELINWLITQIRRRKMDRPLTSDREADLRQAGATQELIDAVKANAPRPQPTPTPILEPVDLGELAGKAVNLVRPEFTEEARQARTAGEVKLALDLDESGRVTSVARLTVLPNGLTERAIEAARASIFVPAMRDGRPTRGKGVLTYTFRINVVDTAPILAAANDFRLKKECDRAITEYNRVLDLNSGNSKALLGRGQCYLMKAEHERALADLRKAAGSDPNDHEIHFFLAVANDLVGDSQAAAVNYEKALAIRPDLDSQPVFNCLFIDRRPMTPEQAKAAASPVINACNQAMKAANDDISGLLLFKRGIAYRLRADYERAIADFQNVQRQYPKFAGTNLQLQIVYNSRGLDAFNKKDYKKAFSDVSLAIQTEPKNPTPYINRCAIHLYAFKQYAEAIQDCTKAIDLSTRSSMAYNHRGYAYEMTNSKDQAIADYRKALDLDPRNETARTNLNRLQPQPPTIKN